MVVIDSIELHDSTLTIAIAGDVVIVALRPAYVHHWESESGKWKGRGLVQDANIRMAGGRIQSCGSGKPIEISSGWFRVGSELFDGLLPAPFAASAEVTAMLELVDGTRVNLTGSGIEINLVGVGKFIEELPVEWAPSDASA